MERSPDRPSGSRDDAALRFAAQWRPRSCDPDVPPTARREYGAILCASRRGATAGHRTARARAGAHGRVLGWIADYLGIGLFGWIAGLRVEGFVHTHPLCGCHDALRFSGPDRFLTRLPGIRAVYLAAPDGRTFRWDGRSVEALREDP